MRIRHSHDHFLPKLLGVGAIIIYPFIFYEDAEPNPRIVRHEMCHAAQVERRGWIRFYVSYLLFYLASRAMGLDHFASYTSIPYEIEAFGAEDEHK